jgi:hypothetical protein
MFGHNAGQLADENGHTAVVEFFKKGAKKHGKDDGKCLIS